MPTPAAPISLLYSWEPNGHRGHTSPLTAPEGKIKNITGDVYPGNDRSADNPKFTTLTAPFTRSGTVITDAKGQTAVLVPREEHPHGVHHYSSVFDRRSADGETVESAAVDRVLAAIPVANGAVG